MLNVIFFTDEVVRNCSIFNLTMSKTKQENEYSFMLHACKEPIGSSVSFLINQTTVDVFTKVGNKCYNSQAECSIDECFCSESGASFKWKYRVKTDANFTFGASTRFSVGNDGQMIKKVYKSNYYRGSGL